MRGKWIWTLVLVVPLTVGFVGCNGKTKKTGKTEEEKTKKTETGKKKQKDQNLVSTKVAPPTAKEPINTKHISDDFIGAVVMHPRRAIESKMIKKMIAQVEQVHGKAAVAQAFRDMQTEFGFDPRKMEQVIILADMKLATEGAGQLMMPGGGSGPPPGFDEKKRDGGPAFKRSKAAFPKSRDLGPPKKSPIPDPKGESGKEADCSVQPKGFPDEKGDPGFGGEDVEDPLPSFIIRFSEPVDQQAFLKKLESNFRRHTKDDQTFPEKKKAFPEKKGNEKKGPAEEKTPEKEKSEKKQPEKKQPEKKDPDAKSPVAKGKKEGLPSKKHGGKTYYLAGPFAVCFVDDKTLIGSWNEDILKRMISADDVESPLTMRLKTIGSENDFVAALVVQPLTAMLAFLPRDEMPPDAREALDFVTKVKTLAVTGSITSGTLLSVIFQMPSAKDAKGFAKLIREKGVTVLRKEYDKMKADPRKKVPQEAEPFVKLVDQMMDGLAVGNHKSDTIISIARPADLDELPKLMLPAIKAARDAARLSHRKNNLKVVGLAMHNYNATHHMFPAADSNGWPKGQGRKDGLSWRVYILPFLDQQPLYEQFNLDEPWDSPHNKQLISKMPQVYYNPSPINPSSDRLPDEGKTSIHVFVGKNNTPFGKQANGQSVGAGFRDITDGTANTLMAVEAGDDKAEIWTKPGGLPFDPSKNPLETLGNISDDGFLALFCDGPVHQIKKSIKPETLKLLIQHNDGEPIGNIPGVRRPSFRRFDRKFDKKAFDGKPRSDAKSADKFDKKE